MPKKTASTRGGASRNKSRSQKSIQVVRPVPTNNRLEVETIEERTNGSVVTSTADELVVEPEVEEAIEVGEVEELTEVKEPKPVKAAKEIKSPKVEAAKPVVATATVAAPKSASARLAARRQATQKTQQRAPATMISAENYRYVRKDLIFIAILAAIMFSAIIILHFVPAIGG